MSLTITTPPASEPETLEQAKRHLNVDDTDSDTLIVGHISSARSACESFLRATLMETVYSYTLDCFPSQIVLPQGPVLTTTGLSISYVDTAGVTQTLATSSYKVSLGDICRIRPAWGMSWPATRNEMDAVTIAFKAGYADASGIPPAVLNAFRMTLHDFFEHRGNMADPSAGRDLPLTAQNLMTAFVRHS